MRFDDLTAYFERLESARGCLEMYQALGEMFGEAETTELGQIAYLLEGRVLPAFTGVEIGMGDRMVAAAIGIAGGKTPRQIDHLYKTSGDLGLVAERLLTPRRSQLDVLGVYEGLLKIARMGGQGSAERKIRALAGLMCEVSPQEGRYIARLAVGRLRLGVGVQTIMEAAARGYSDHWQARVWIEQAYNRCADLGLVLRTLRRNGLDAVKRFKIRVGVPVRMMMAERLPSDHCALGTLLGRIQTGRLPLPDPPATSHCGNLLAKPRAHNVDVPGYCRFGSPATIGAERDY